jgi:hypothetical protein
LALLFLSRKYVDLQTKMKYVWFIAITACARFLVTAVSYPPGDGDLAWQRWLGRTILATHHIPRALGNEAFTAVGAAWTPQEWLFGIAAALGSAGIGWVVLAVSVAFCATATVIFVGYRTYKRGVPAVYAACAAVLVTLSQLASFGVRAQVVAWSMLALMLLIADNEGPWLWACVPVAVLWSNIHASAVLAPLLLGAITLGRFLDRGALEDRAWRERVRRGVCVTAASCVAVCCNPFGIGLPVYAVSLFANPIKKYISEWKVSGLGEDVFLWGALPILLCLVVLGCSSSRKISVGDMILLVAFTFLLFLAARNIPLFAIVAAPFVAQLLHEVVPIQREKSAATRLDRVAGIALPVFAVVMTFLVGYGLFRSSERTEITMPSHEVSALVKMPGEHRIMCVDFAWCSYFLGIPGQRVFLDGRADPYPPKVWREFASVAYLRPEWRTVLDGYRVNAVVTRRATPTDQALALTRQWKDAARDQKFRLWIR